MATRHDEDAMLAQRGQLSGLVRQEIGHRLDRRVLRILDGLVMRYRNGDLGGDDARAGIAAIAELKGLLDDLDRDVRQAEEARERLMTAPGPP